MKRVWIWAVGLLCLATASCQKDPHINCIQGKASATCACIVDTVYVCGCNNKTYINSCVAGCDGITFYTLGKCK